MKVEIRIVGISGNYIVRETREVDSLDDALARGRAWADGFLYYREIEIEQLEDVVEQP